MGTATSHLWNDLCAIESHDELSRRLEMLSQSPYHVQEARDAGYYEGALKWLIAYRNGRAPRFPWATHWSQQQPNKTLEMRGVSYFYECLALLGIAETEPLTHSRIRAAYKRATLTAHPDKGGTPEAFEAINAATSYLASVLDRINPVRTEEEERRLTQAVSVATAAQHRSKSDVPMDDKPAVTLSAKKLNRDVFNQLFEENKLPDPAQDSGYGDWLRSSPDAATDEGPNIKPSQFEAKFHERVLKQKPSSAIMQYTVPEPIVSACGYELGGDGSNFTAAFGSDTQFTDLKEAYTTGATMYQNVANIRVKSTALPTAEAISATRAAEITHLDPDELSRIAIAEAALEERERQRKLRVAHTDIETEAWHKKLRRLLLVNTA